MEPVHATAEMLPGGCTHTLGRVSTLTQHDEAVALTASLGSGCGHAADAMPGLQTAEPGTPDLSLCNPSLNDTRGAKRAPKHVGALRVA